MPAIVVEKEGNWKIEAFRLMIPQEEEKMKLCMRFNDGCLWIANVQRYRVDSGLEISTREVEPFRTGLLHQLAGIRMGRE